jgi:hypothetical protein
MKLAEFQERYPHCKSYADCRTEEEQKLFIFGWGSLDEMVNWLQEHRSDENLRDALMTAHDNGEAAERRRAMPFEDNKPFEDRTIN